jgi:hypothetical protein
MLGLRRRLSLVFLIGSFTLFQGCASIQSASGTVQSGEEVSISNCRDYFVALDEQIAVKGVGDAQYQRITAFPYLRLSRFAAALNNPVDTASASFVALVETLRALDAEAREIEVANAGMDLKMNVEQVAHCGRTLAAADLADAKKRSELSKRLVVEDDYSTAFRFFGAYALTKLPFARGVERLEAERTSTLKGNPKSSPYSVRRLLYPPLSPNVQVLDLSAILSPPAHDMLKIPNPSSAALAYLFDRFAPVFDLEIASDADESGALQWAPDPRVPKLVVDSAKPTVYHQTAVTRYQGHNLLQLVYTIWFAARPKEQGATLDLLAGSIDGLTFRVTLAPDGTPLVYDSIHPCGCYHIFFPTLSAQVKPAPQNQIEWAYAPIVAPTLAFKERLIVKVAAGTHYIDRIEAGTLNDPAAQTYQWVDYQQLRSLPFRNSTSRSAFDHLGFMPGTDRLESWLFWPMGIKRAGTMRQWGRHATAFVGRRHFDDAYLMEQRFTFDPRHFSSAVPF